MNPAKFLYIDKHGVSLTRHTLKVREKSFPVKIISYRPVILKAKKFPGIMTLLVGFILCTSGYLKAATAVETGLPVMAVYAGLGMTAAGVLIFFLTRERYALQITTSAGVKNVVTSHDKEYIATIVHALDSTVAGNNMAFHRERMQQVA